MISELCAELQNYFLRDYANPEQYIHTGSFVIANGEIQNLPFLKNGQYYRIIGSTFNEGVHKYGGKWEQYDPPAVLVDETFEGAIWEMCVPPDFVQLAQEIKEWTVQNAEAINSPYQSESFETYSRTMKTGGGSSGSASYSWENQFAKRLNRYRRISVL